MFGPVIRKYTWWIHTDSVYFCGSCERELIGWRHKTHRWCKIEWTLSLRKKQSRTIFWGVISRQKKKLRRPRFMVISPSLDLYCTFLRKAVGKIKGKFRRSSTLNVNWRKGDGLQQTSATRAEYSVVELNEGLPSLTSVSWISSETVLLWRPSDTSIYKNWNWMKIKLKSLYFLKLKCLSTSLLLVSLTTALVNWLSLSLQEDWPTDCYVWPLKTSIEFLLNGLVTTNLHEVCRCLYFLCQVSSLPLQLPKIFHPFLPYWYLFF